MRKWSWASVHRSIEKDERSRGNSIDVPITWWESRSCSRLSSSYPQSAKQKLTATARESFLKTSLVWVRAAPIGTMVVLPGCIASISTSIACRAALKLPDLRSTVSRLIQKVLLRALPAFESPSKLSATEKLKKIALVCTRTFLPLFIIFLLIRAPEAWLRVELLSLSENSLCDPGTDIVLSLLVSDLSEVLTIESPEPGRKPMGKSKVIEAFWPQVYSRVREYFVLIQNYIYQISLFNTLFADVSGRFVSQHSVLESQRKIITSDTTSDELTLYTTLSVRT